MFFPLNFSSHESRSMGLNPTSCWFQLTCTDTKRPLGQPSYLKWSFFPLVLAYCCFYSSSVTVYISNIALWFSPVHQIIRQKRTVMSTFQIYFLVAIQCLSWSEHSMHTCWGCRWSNMSLCTPDWQSSGLCFDCF